MTSNAPQQVGGGPPADSDRDGMQVRRKSRPGLILAISRTATRIATAMAVTEAAICERFKWTADLMGKTAIPNRVELAHVRVPKLRLNQVAGLHKEGVSLAR